MNYYNFQAYRLENNEVFTLQKTDIVLNLINYSKKHPEDKLKTMITKYTTIIKNMINNLDDLHLNEENLFYVDEFTLADAGRIDLLYISSFGDIIIIELKIKDNLNSRHPLKQILGYVNNIKKEKGETIIKKMKEKETKFFEKFAFDNNIDEKTLTTILDNNLKNNNILSFLIFNKLDKNITEIIKNDLEIFKDNLSKKFILAEILSFSYNDLLLIIPSPQNLITINLQITTEKIISDISNKIDELKNEFYNTKNLYDTTNDNINNTLDFFHNYFQIKSKNTEKIEELKELIINEGIRLNVKSFNSLFKQNDLSNKVPSRSVCYQILGPNIINEISKFWGDYNNSDEMIIDFLINLSHELNRTPTSKECTDRGLHVNNIRYHFGTYNSALRKAGLTPIIEHTKPTKEEIINEIINISKSVSKHVVREYKNKGGRYHWYLHYFGTFENALKSCGILIESNQRKTEDT